MRISYVTGRGVLATVVLAILFSARVAVAQTGASIPDPVQLFPKEAHIAFVDFNQVAANSVPGKEIAARLKAFWDGKVAALSEKRKQLDGTQTQLDRGAAVLNDEARGQLTRSVEKMKREIQFGTQDAQAELDEMEQDALADLRKRIAPILKDIASERNLDAIFSLAETAVPFVSPRVDLSAEVTRRLDAASGKKQP